MSFFFVCWQIKIQMQISWVGWSTRYRVDRGDINFGILRDPLKYLFLTDLNGPYLIEFLIENGSFLLTKANLFEANWTAGHQLRRPFCLTSHCEKASGMRLGLTGSLWCFQKWCEKVRSDQKWPSYTLQRFENYQQIRAIVAAAVCENHHQNLIQATTAWSHFLICESW